MNPDDRPERVRRLADRAELSELADRYCLAIDDSDWAALLGQFTVDAEMAGATGRGEVVGVLRSIRSGFGRTVHTVLAQTLEFPSDDEARGVATGRGELALGGQTVVLALRYLDHYSRVEGRWRFARRSETFGYALPWDRLAEAVTADDPVAWP